MILSKEKINKSSKRMTFNAGHPDIKVSTGCFINVVL
jgi:hypothetical protein